VKFSLWFNVWPGMKQEDIYTFSTRPTNITNSFTKTKLYRVDFEVMDADVVINGRVEEENEDQRKGEG